VRQRGKLFDTFISLIGIGVVAVPTGIVSASFVEILEEEKNRKKLNHRHILLF